MFNVLKMKNTTILLLLATILLHSCTASTKTTTAAAPSIDQLPNNLVFIFEQPAVKERYVLNNSLNPFYIRGNFDGDTQPDYAEYLLNKATKQPAFALIRGTEYVIKESTDFPCLTNHTLQYWKETNRFPTGSGLPNHGGGIVLQLEKEAVGWIYWDGKAWQCVSPQ